MSLLGNLEKGKCSYILRFGQKSEKTSVNRVHGRCVNVKVVNVNINVNVNVNVNKNVELFVNTNVDVFVNVNINVNVNVNVNVVFWANTVVFGGKYSGI